jgi:dTDP-4-amino-4,6-dideoxygalactose transaminase
MTFSASVNPILYLGATPILLIVNLILEFMSYEEAIIDRISKGIIPKAIIAIALYGVPYKMKKLEK